MSDKPSEIKDLATAISVLEFVSVELKELLRGERGNFSSQLQEYREVFALLMSLKKEIKEEIKQISASNTGRLIPSKNFEDLKIVLEAVKNELARPAVSSGISTELRSIGEKTSTLAENSQSIQREIESLKGLIGKLQPLDRTAQKKTNVIDKKRNIVKYLIPLASFVMGSVTTLLLLILS